MKNQIYAAACLAVISPLCLVAAPTGTISVDQTVLREGDIPRLTWNVNIPVTDIEEIIEITPTGGGGGDDGVIPGGTITAQTDLRAEVFMIGTAVSNHRQRTDTWVNLGSSWSRVYYGYGTDLDPTVPRLTVQVSSGTQVRFAARYEGGNYYYNTEPNVLLMTNGAVPSPKHGWGGDTSMEDYVRPYLDENGAMDLGEFDIMFAAELTHSQQYKDQAGYDSNDSIVLVRFSEL